MTTFKDLESLQHFLKQDAERVSLNPVRFINVDSMAMWIARSMAILTVQTYLMWYFGLLSIKQFVRLRTHRKKKCRSLVPGSKHMGFLLLSHNGVRT